MNIIYNETLLLYLLRTLDLELQRLDLDMFGMKRNNNNNDIR